MIRPIYSGVKVLKSCEEYRELISAYYDFELDRATRMEVEAHVESCAQCAEVFRQYGEICGPLDTGAMPSSVAQPVMERITSAVSESDPFDKQGGEKSGRQSRPLSRTAKSWLTVAACLLLLITSVLFNQGPVSEYQIYESAGMDQAMSSASFSDNGEQFEDGYAESKAEPESSASGSVSASAAQPLLAALENARQVRIKLDGADITVTDPASIEQLRLFLEEQPADAEADVSAADTVDTVELVPDAGLEISITADYTIVCKDGEQTVSIAPEKAALEETLQKLDQ